MSKCKSYPFSKEGLNKAKIDSINDKVGLVLNVGIYGTMGVLFITGIIGTQWLVSYACCTGVSRSVKWAVRNGYI